MRVPLKWLNEYCDSGMAVDELAERLAMTGTEVERGTDRGTHECGNAVRQELCDEGARHDHAAVDIKAVFAEPGFMRQISGGNALADSPFD